MNPTHFTCEDGGPWNAWGVHGYPVRVHAIRFDTGDVWDFVNGWRDRAVFGATSPPTAISEDPWAHRAISMRCATCMWFAKKGEGDLGRCRRRAPELSGYPAVFVTDWCGDHKLDETKL